jgi:hypothetical protein
LCWAVSPTASGLVVLAESDLAGAAVAVIHQDHLLDVVQGLGDADVIPEGGIGRGKLVRHRGQRGAGQRDLVVIVGHMFAVKELHRIVHQPVVDAGDGQRGDGRGLGGSRQSRGAGRARQQFCQAAPIDFFNGRSRSRGRFAAFAHNIPLQKSPRLLPQNL